MAVNVTTKAKAVTEQQLVTNQIILQIENVPTIYGAVELTEIVRIGDAGLIIGGFTVGGSRKIPNSRPYVSLEGTTNNLTSQMRQDEGGENSISKFTVNLVDEANYVSNEFASGNFVDDILGANADIYLSFEGLSFPEDATKIFNGVIDDISFENNSVKVSIAHPERLKRRELFLPTITSLTSTINDSTLSIPVLDTSGLTIEEDSYIETYIRIEDELIRYSSASGGVITATERGALGTVATTHDTESDVETIYRLQGEPIELALALMLSNTENEYYQEGVKVFNIENDRIYIDSYNAAEEFGIVEGDLLTLTGSTEGNDFVKEPITEIGIDQGVVFLQVNLSLTDENIDGPTISIRSKYNLMNEGCGMNPKQVDVAQHETIQNLVGGSFPPLDFILREEENAKDFISKEIYFPMGMYALNRKARASVGYTLPPVALFQTKTLNADTITNADKLSVKRSTNKNFYNTIHYKYEQNIVVDRFLAGRITTNEDSINRIKTGTKQLLIESRGLRNTSDVTTFIDAQADRFLDRYKFAAESIDIEVAYAFGYTIELGDRVQINGGDVGLFLYSQGTREPQPKVFEVTNKSMNIKTGKIKLTCLDTVFGTNGRFATIAPSSKIGAGSTNNRIVIVPSYGTSVGEEEFDKWTDYINSKVLIRSSDYTYSELTTLRAAGDGFLSVDPLSAPPLEDYIVDTPEYSDANDNYKVLHAFTSPREFVALGGDNISFTIADATTLFVGATVRINTPDYSESGIRKVAEIDGLVVTLDRALDFIPTTSDEVNQIGFVEDKGDSYLYL